MVALATRAPPRRWKYGNTGRQRLTLIGCLKNWLLAPPLTGRLALLCGIVAVALPTSIRAAIDGIVTGCEFTPYLPFVLLSAILLRWWQAGLIALVSAVTLGGLFVGPPNEFLASRCFITSAGTFLAASAMMIGTVILVRRVVGAIQSRGADESSGGIIFSLEEDQVWASWSGHGSPVRLGSQKKVSEMMEDFLAQVEVGKRLTNRFR